MDIEFECGIGWKRLYQPIIDKVDSLNETLPEDKQIKILQIKEKFAGLRIYLENANEELMKMVHEAESESYQVCERCGTSENVGILNTGGWYYNCCQECAKKLIKNAQDCWKDRKMFWRNSKTNEMFEITTLNNEFKKITK